MVIGENGLNVHKLAMLVQKEDQEYAKDKFWKILYNLNEIHLNKIFDSMNRLGKRASFIMKKKRDNVLKNGWSYVKPHLKIMLG